jgi:hypothetical protein
MADKTTDDSSSDSKPKGKGPDKSREDISEDIPYGAKVLTEIGEDIFSDLGEAFGDVPMVRALLEKLRASDPGKMLGSFAIAPALQAWAEKKGLVSATLKALGAPDFLVTNANEMLGGFFEGLRRKYRENGGSLTRGDVAQVRKQLQTDIAARLAEPLTYAQALQTLNTEEQVVFQNKIADLGEDRLPLFNKIKTKISSPKDMRVLLKLRVDQWIPHLEQKYGSLASPPKSGMVLAIDKVFGVITSAVNKAVEPMPEAEKKKHENDLQVRREQIEQRRANRLKKPW